jgi:shikimate dehydrogenase
MHNAAFRAHNLDFLYVAFKVKSHDLKGAVEGIKKLGIRGFNITIPHKMEIIKFLDEVDESALDIGAVNTVVRKGEKLVGYNTDGSGALKALIDGNADPKDKKVVLLGAGGAARTIAFYISPLSERLVIINRTESRAKKLSKILEKKSNSEVVGLGISQKNLSKALLDADILINATPVGMYPHSNETLVESSMLRSDMVVFDLVYNPIMTKLLREVKKAGARPINGVSMLVYQGAEAFEMWTEMTPPIDLMFKVVTERLEIDQS